MLSEPHRGIRLSDQSRELIELVWAMAAVIRKSYPVTVSPFADGHGEGQRGFSVNFDAEQAAQALVDAGYRAARTEALSTDGLEASRDHAPTSSALGWRPISVLPTGGFFIVWPTTFGVPEVWAVETYHQAMSRNRPPALGHLADSARMITHWMPLPEAPTLADEGSALRLATGSDTLAEGESSRAAKPSTGEGEDAALISEPVSNPYKLGRGLEARVGEAVPSRDEIARHVGLAVLDGENLGRWMAHREPAETIALREQSIKGRTQAILALYAGLPDPVGGGDNQTSWKLADIEKDLIQRAIHVCDGNISEAAKLLGIGRSTLYQKIVKTAKE